VRFRPCFGLIAEPVVALELNLRLEEIGMNIYGTCVAI
jgi:hypothetical protein